MTMSSASKPVGYLIREWRKRRRLSQLDLALDAEISTRLLGQVKDHGHLVKGVDLCRFRRAALRMMSLDTSSTAVRLRPVRNTLAPSPAPLLKSVRIASCMSLIGLRNYRTRGA
jgi:hypothetical protein